MTVCFKTQYRTKGDARAALAGHYRKRSKSGRRAKRRRGGPPKTVYKCPWCPYWHITSKGSK